VKRGRGGYFQVVHHDAAKRERKKTPPVTPSGGIEVKEGERRLRLLLSLEDKKGESANFRKGGKKRNLLSQVFL